MDRVDLVKFDRGAAGGDTFPLVIVVNEEARVIDLAGNLTSADRGAVEAALATVASHGSGQAWLVYCPDLTVTDHGEDLWIELATKYLKSLGTGYGPGQLPMILQADEPFMKNNPNAIFLDPL